MINEANQPNPRLATSAFFHESKPIRPQKIANLLERGYAEVRLKQVLFLIVMVGWGLGLLSEGRAVETGEEMTPMLGEVFPLEKIEKGVRITRPVLINLTTIIPAGSVARNIFVPPRANDADVRQQRHREEKKVAYSAIKVPDMRQDGRSPEVRAAEERANKVRWEDDMQFRVALLRMRLIEAFLVYDDAATGQAKMESFAFPENLFLAEMDGVVTVLAVGNNSNAERAGIKAGTRILGLNGERFERGLISFQNRYVVERDAARAEGRPLVLTVQLAGTSETREISLAQARPLELGNFFNAMDVEVAPAPVEKKEEEVDPFKPRKE